MYISVNEINKSYKPSLGIVADVHHFMSDLIKELENVNFRHFNRKKLRLELIKSNYESNSSVSKHNNSDFDDIETITADIMHTLDDERLLLMMPETFLDGWPDIIRLTKRGLI